MKRKTKVLLVAGVLCAAVAAWRIWGPATGVPFMAWRNFGGPATRAIANADTVDVFRIFDERENGTWPTHLHQYRILGQGKTEGGDFARRLRETLFDQEFHSFEMQNSCNIHPGLVYRMNGSGGSVDVVVCFRCADLMLYDTNEQSPMYKAVSRNFHPIYREMVGLAKETLPDDKAIQKLNSEKVGR